MTDQPNMELSPRLKEELNTIMGLGESGTVYLKFRDLLITLERQAETGDLAAKEILTQVSRFARLVEISQREIR